MSSPGSAIGLAFVPVQVDELADVIALALDHTDPRIAAYAVEPRAAMWRARIKAAVGALPWLGERVARPERSFWIVSNGERAGVLLLDLNAPWLHLHFVVLTPTVRGTGAADRVLAFVEEQARLAEVKGVDLYVDRRNYRAYHLYVRHGFQLGPERRFIFEVPRSRRRTVSSLVALPWHAVAEVVGLIGGSGLSDWFSLGHGPRIPLTVREGGMVAVTLEDPESIDAAVCAVFRNTLARSVRVSLPFAANVPGGRLVAILQRMEKVLT